MSSENKKSAFLQSLEQTAKELSMSMDSATGRKQGFIILASDENPDEGNNAAIIAVVGQHSAFL